MTTKTNLEEINIPADPLEFDQFLSNVQGSIPAPVAEPEKDPEPAAEPETDPEPNTEKDPEPEPTVVPETDPEEDPKEPDPDKDKEPEEEVDENKEVTELTAEEQLSNLFKPIKANGQDITLDNIDEIRRLVQMGIGNEQKMRILKPHLKLIKSLDQASLLNENKLNTLIDISKGDINALATVMKEHNITQDNLNDLFNEEGDNISQYNPSNNILTDKQFQLTDTLDTLKSKPKYDEFMREVESFDPHSIEMMNKNPRYLTALYAHYDDEDNLYTKIKSEYDKQILLGKYDTFTPFLEIYPELAKIVYNKLKKQETVEQNPDSNKEALAKALATKGKKTVPATKTIKQKLFKDTSKMSDEELEDYLNDLKQ